MKCLRRHILLRYSKAFFKHALSRAKKYRYTFRSSGSVPIFYSLNFQAQKTSSVFSQIVSEKGFLQNVRHNLRESFFKQALKCNTIITFSSLLFNKKIPPHFAEAGFLCIAKRVTGHGASRNGFLPKPAVLSVISAPRTSDYVLFRFGCLFISKETNRCNTDQFIEDHKHGR